MSTPKPITAFISGPITFPATYFTQHYAARLRAAVVADHRFVVGPAPGIDTIALDFLLVENSVPPSHIAVYLCGFEAVADYGRYEAMGVKVVVEGLTTGERDAAMTRDSDYDVLRYMGEEEAREFYGAAYYPRITNTEKNERRRKGLPLSDFPEEASMSAMEEAKKWLKRRQNGFLTK